MGELRKRLWFNIFINVGLIFLIFLVVLMLASSALLARFFSYKQRNELVKRVEQVAVLNLSDNKGVLSTLKEISDSNLEAEIYTLDGRVIYTTQGSQLMDYFEFGNSSFKMAHDRFVTNDFKVLKNDILYVEATREFDKSEFLICRKNIDSKTVAEVRVRRQLLLNSAKVAGEFTVIVAAICLVGAAVWILFFARKFSRPLSLMNEITGDMAELKFERRIETERDDEIGQLAHSINIMSDSLSSAMNSLTEANARLKDEIELERSLDKMRREFVADVSHELKTPISIISGYAEGLKLNINAKSREEYCDTIISESARMNRLVLSILELSKYQSNQIPINPTAFDISPVSRQMAERILGSDISLEFEIPQNTFVLADELQTEQVLKAFLENAASHTPPGGTVTLGAEDRGERIRISVHNTGSHIKNEIMPNIWQSFYRGDSSHKREQNRFGLGLSIVGAIMKLHETDCGVYNTENGVCFWFETQKPSQQ